VLIELLLGLIYRLLDILLIFEIPPLPLEASTYINTLFNHLVSGASILANYTPLSYLLTLFGIIVAVDVGINIYKFVMWIIKKIPFLGVE